MYFGTCILLVGHITCVNLDPPYIWLGICGVYVNSSIMDERVPLQYLKFPTRLKVDSFQFDNTKPI